MTKANATKRTNSAPTDDAVPVILFGLESDKPKAARFTEKHAAAAIKAAQQLKLAVLPVSTDEAKALTTKLAEGRVFTTGRGMIPFVRRDLYDRILAAAKKAGVPAPDVASGPTGAPAAIDLPRNWEDIRVGQTVVAYESDEDGWFEAVVIERIKGTLSLRWRNYAWPKRFTRNYLSVGLLHPAAEGLEPEGVSTPLQNKNDTKANGTAQPKLGSADVAAAEVKVGQTVLAQDDSPYRARWEATVTERIGDQFKLSWRGSGSLTIKRTREALTVLSGGQAS